MMIREPLSVKRDVRMHCHYRFKMDPPGRYLWTHPLSAQEGQLRPRMLNRFFFQKPFPTGIEGF
jgi:hypothetical protein